MASSAFEKCAPACPLHPEPGRPRLPFPFPPVPRNLLLELDEESTGRLAGALLSGEPCAIPLPEGRSLAVRSDAFGVRLVYPVL